MVTEWYYICLMSDVQYFTIIHVQFKRLVRHTVRTRSNVRNIWDTLISK